VQEANENFINICGAKLQHVIVGGDENDNDDDNNQNDDNDDNNQNDDNDDNNQDNAN